VCNFILCCMCNSVLKMQHVCVAIYCVVYARMGFVTHDKYVCMCRLHVQVTTNARRTYVCTIGSVFCVIVSECVRYCCRSPMSCILAELQQWKAARWARVAVYLFEECN